MSGSIIETYLHLIVILFLLGCVLVLVVLLHQLTGNFFLGLSLGLLITSFAVAYIVSGETIVMLAFAFIVAFMLLLALFRNAVLGLFISSIIVSVLVFLELFVY